MIDVRARDNSGARNGLRFLLRGLSAALAILFVTSCGNNLFIAGTPVVTLTAQRGNFTSYIVSIDQINMTRLDGTVVQLPLVSQRVDLAQQTGFVQLLMTPALQEGTYVSATFFLDYGGSGSAPLASVTIDDNGFVGATTLIDASTGTAPTVDTITVTFDPAHPLVVGNQTSSLINFNIDLEASNTINIPNGIPAVVTTHPIITATAAPVYQQPIFVRGLFVFADTNAGNFVMNTRPLRDMGYSNGSYNGGATTGAITVLPNAQTYFNIDGVTYVGAAGIAQLSALKGETASLQIAAVGTTTAIGGLNMDTPTFTATEVYAGTSLESTIQDHITGIVAGRSGNTITVNAASLVDRIGDLGFSQSIPVTLAPITATSGTIVSVDGVASPSPAPTIDTISIGQYIEVSGVVNPNGTNNGYVNVNPDGSFNPTALDATYGQLRIKPTTLWGTLNSATPGSASVSLNWIQNYEPSFYDFTGAGTNTSATNYTINTGTTDLTPNVNASAPPLFQFVGLTTPFGSGPPDFNATTITAASSLPQQLIIEFGGSNGYSTNPFASIAAAGLVVNLQDSALAGTLHVLRRGPPTADVDVMTLPNPNPGVLAVVPATGNPQNQYLFTVGNVTNSISAFSDPTGFAVAVQAYVNNAGGIRKIVATGQYDGAGHFVATNIEVAAK
jgi:hypothetical protein